MIDYYAFEAGSDVTGVLAIDPIVVEDILRIIGPIEVPGYGVVVSSDNVTYQIQYQVHHNVNTMATRKDFVSVLGEILFEKVMSAEGDQLKQILKTGMTNLNEKHILLYNSNLAVQDLLCERNWCGAVAETSGDYLMTIDTNVSINKTNFFVRKATEYEVRRSTDGSLNARVTMKYDNPSEWGWPGGPYTTYVRVYAPYGSVLSSATGLHDQPQTLTEYEGTAKARTVFAGVVRMDVKSQKDVVFSYQLPQTLADAAYQYDLLVQKQAGTATIPAEPGYRGDPLTVRFIDETGTNINGTGNFRYQDGMSQLELVTDLKQDVHFSAQAL